MAQQSTPSLTAKYTSPTNEAFSIDKPLPTTPPSADVAAKTEYLSALRAAVTSTQDQVNKELTARMEEDKARAAPSDAAAAKKAGVDEDKEEENYGEEVQEEED